MPKAFQDLVVWRKAVDLSVYVYKLTAEFPKAELYGLTSQMRRASVSIASNIAEGSARGTKKDFKYFITIAKGSNCELQTQLVIAERLGLGEGNRIIEAQSLSFEVTKMLNGLSHFLAKE